jgi:hypothetical protein
MPVLLTGKMDNRGDEKNFLVETIDTKETADSARREVFLKIPKGTTVDRLKALKALLMEHRGNQQVILSFEGAQKKEIPLPFGITWTDSLGYEITQLLS